MIDYRIKNSLETVIGLEVHAELNTKSKIFCSCSTAFGGESNSKTCPVCTGQPGSLPMFNDKVAEHAVKLGLALSCSINPYSKFDRKNYFYPDLPKAYQISQLYSPICSEGKLELDAGDFKKIIGIREIHIEEDAGKLIHDTSGSRTLIDYNRAGVPLLEIVTQPDFGNAEEVIIFLERLIETMLYLDICDCKMQEGSLRVDVNLSLKESGAELGTRTETKNLNSFKAISHAINYEAERQREILNKGLMVEQETRRWDEEKNCSFPMRSKENVQDYRYFPEPDLNPLVISDEWLNEIKSAIPELAQEKRNRYIAEYGLSPLIAGKICSRRNIAELFEELSKKSGEAREAANLINGILMELINNKNMDPFKLKIDSEKLSTLITMLAKGKINRSVYKETITAVFNENIDPELYIKDRGLFIVSDNDAVNKAVDKVIKNNAEAAKDFKEGKEKVFSYLMGETIKNLGGKSDPALIKKILLEKLNNFIPCRREANA